MTTTIQKWGNSFGVRLPREVVRKRALHEGSRVEVSDSNEGIIIRVLTREVHTASLADLVRGVRADNTHRELSWDAPQGNEVW